MSDNSVNIYCQISEKESVKVKFAEEILNFKIENVGIGYREIGYSQENIMAVLLQAITLDDVTSQVNGTGIDFTVTKKILKMMGIWINGLKDRGYAVINDTTVRVQPVVEAGDSLEILYIGE
jgi:hypothetical protein